MLPMWFQFLMWWFQENKGSFGAHIGSRTSWCFGTRLWGFWSQYWLKYWVLHWIVACWNKRAPNDIDGSTQVRLGLETANVLTLGLGLSTWVLEVSILPKSVKFFFDPKFANRWCDIHCCCWVDIVAIRSLHLWMDLQLLSGFLFWKQHRRSKVFTAMINKSWLSNASLCHQNGLWVGI